MKRLPRYWILFLFLVGVAGVWSNSVLFADQLGSAPQTISENASPTTGQEKVSFSDIFFEKYADDVTYLDLKSIGEDVTKHLIIGVPPKEEDKLDQEDEGNRVKIAGERIQDPTTGEIKVIPGEATQDEKLAALTAIDNVFAFSSVLGGQFNYKKLKEVETFFQKVDSDVGVAVSAAKKTFRRPRPMKSSGFSYPSGHSTRAFVREALLSEIFPKCQEALYNQAQQFAQNRVIIGRHYPRDIAAGEIYGKYLADQFRKNLVFQREWSEVKKEIATLFKQPQNFNPIVTPVVTPAIAPVMPPIVSENIE